METPLFNSFSVFGHLWSAVARNIAAAHKQEGNSEYGSVSKVVAVGRSCVAFAGHVCATPHWQEWDCSAHLYLSIFSPAVVCTLPALFILGVAFGNW